MHLIFIRALIMRNHSAPVKKGAVGPDFLGLCGIFLIFMLVGICVEKIQFLQILGRVIILYLVAKIWSK